MADTDDTKQENAKGEDVKDEKKSLIKRILPVMIIVIAAGLFAGAGFGLGKMLVPETSEQDETDSEVLESEDMEITQEDIDSEDTWYYDMEPVVAMLDEPNVARYISITLTLQISSVFVEKDGRAYIDEKIPILTDWMTVYLAGLGLEEIGGDKNLKIIKSEILDAFNGQLFPESKPMIIQVLFRNFAVQ
jgi:flagellar basal body-associated protein FliL